MIFDEELLINCNRMLQGLNLSMDPLLEEKLAKSLDTKSFLTIGDVSIYRKEQRVTRIFNKKGFDPSNSTPEGTIQLNAKKEMETRLAAYTIPQRSKSQKDLLQKLLPSQCKY